MTMTGETERRILSKRLAIVRSRDHIPAALLDVVEKVYLRQIQAREEAAPPAPGRRADADLHAQGAPLCPRSEFPHDAAQAAGLMREFIELLKTAGAPASLAATTVEAALDTGEVEPETVFRAYLDENGEFFSAWEERTPEAPRTMIFLAQASLTPSIAAAARAMAAAHDLDTVWTHQYCPMCGDLPLMAELRGKEGAHYASCSFCRTSYRIPRMACAFCGEADAKKLAYFTAEDEAGYRVEVCNSCKTYIKASDFRELDKQPLPVIDDLESLALDILADNEGYNRPTLSGLGF
ncbi:formate dehydrogenase accessory protein FdhE [Desulfocurvus sp. DL9XJH121]